MRRLSYKIVLVLLLALVATVYMVWILNTLSIELLREKSFESAREQWIDTRPSTTHKVHDTTRIVISFVVCDSRFNESMNVVKSILLFTRVHLHFVIFTDDVLWSKFNETLTKIRATTNNQLGFELHKISFPEPNREDWLNLFSKCAAQRLFIPKLIPHIDAMIYVDTDTLFLGPVEELWNYFTRFNTSQISAMALEDDNPNVSWYPRFAKHPFYGKYGLNSGVMLMNLTRMREFGWTDYVTPIMLKWKLYIPWGDQDIINIIFHFHERAVYELSCRYNYRPDQCMYGDACADAASKGVFLLHGSRRAFHNNKQPAFQAIYQAIELYELGTDPSETLLSNISRYITESPTSNCGNLKASFLRVPTNTFKLLYSLPVR